MKQKLKDIMVSYKPALKVEIDFYDGCTYFSDINEALQHKAELEAQAKEMDLT